MLSELACRWVQPEITYLKRSWKIRFTVNAFIVISWPHVQQFYCHKRRDSYWVLGLKTEESVFDSRYGQEFSVLQRFQTASDGPSSLLYRAFVPGGVFWG
jgi:hypothetical protein